MKRFSFSSAKRARFSFVKKLLIFSILLAPCFSFTSCGKKQFTPLNFVSELRDNVLYAECKSADDDVDDENKDVDETENFTLTVHSVLRENPYVSDGLKGDTVRLTTFYFSAKDGSDPYSIRYETAETSGGGATSYDDVKKTYYYTCDLDSSLLTSLRAIVTNERTNRTYEFNAKSVKSERTLSSAQILDALFAAQTEKLSELRKENDFSGEIRLRLLYSDGKTYYYAGIVNREKDTISYLLDGETGKILAVRESDER